MHLAAANHAKHLSRLFCHDKHCLLWHLASSYMKPLPIPNSLCKSLLPLVVARVKESLGTL